jgi:hypothetical protein
LHDRDAAADAEGEGGDLQAGGGLLALVFVEVDLADDVVDHGLVEALGDEVGAGQAFLDVTLEDGVERLVGRQAVLVGLVGAQLRARRLVDAWRPG